MAHLNKMKPVVSERYNRNDTSVTAQVLKIISANPDAVLIGASGTPGVLPQKTLIERGYRGKIYHTHGVLNKDFLRVGGKDVEGALAPAAPVLVADELPATHPVKKVATAFKQLYEGKYGPDSLSPFAANAWDAYLLIEGAIPRALKKAKPGTADFRKALRDEMEATKNLTATQGVINMSPQDHLGFALDAPVMVVSKGGRWMLAK
jgi:branched-chain amino acid transport system substrate-binding protein